jgi:acetyl/propionyl-CoA carboxylase alpha subunit
VQVLCDASAARCTSYERECSVQRKHQKLLEESPSPALAPAEREALGAARAARAAASIGYRKRGHDRSSSAPRRASCTSWR